MKIWFPHRCPFPAALDDCGAALAWLAAHELDGAGAPMAAPADAVFLVGDSSGGGLAVAAALANGAAANRAPVAGVVGFSPWLDLTCGGDSYETRKFDAATKRGDPVFNSGDAETERDETRETPRRKSTSGSSKHFKPLHLDSADSWTNRVFSASSFRTVKRRCRTRASTCILKSC